MSEPLTPEDKLLIPNSDEENLLRILRKNLMMGGEIQTIVKRFEQEVADGMDADEAKVTDRGCSRILHRRITDFSAERSFAQTEQALREHYGIEVRGPYTREKFRPQTG